MFFYVKLLVLDLDLFGFILIYDVINFVGDIIFVYGFGGFFCWIWLWNCDFVIFWLFWFCYEEFLFYYWVFLFGYNVNFCELGIFLSILDFFKSFLVRMRVYG